MKNLLRGSFGREIGFNVALPWLVYVLAQPSMGRTHALMASALPPIVWSLVQLIRKRRVDALSVFVVAGIGLSLLAFLGGGSFRMLELREHLVSGVMGVVCLGSVAIRRPVAAVVLRTMVEREPGAPDSRLADLLDDHARLTRMTLLVGCLLLVQTAFAGGLVFTLPVRAFLVVSPIVNYALLGFMCAGVFLYSKHRERKAAAQAGHGRRESSP